MYKYYDYECKACQIQEERFLSPDELNSKVVCSVCLNGMNKILSANMGQVKGTDNPVRYIKKKQ